MNIDQLLDELPNDDSVSTRTLDTDIAPTGPSCEKCAAPLAAHESLVCQQCGWYASINAYVEIDRSWEIATDPKLATEDDAGPAPSAKLPAWAWILASCIVGVIVSPQRQAGSVRFGRSRSSFSDLLFLLFVIRFASCR